jgi:hypothetical protein
VRLMGCRFHLGQAWFRVIQKFGLATKYKDPEDEAGKWMRYLFGLPYLNPEEVGDCFAFDFGALQPTDNRITQLADYLVEHYIQYVPGLSLQEGKKNFFDFTQKLQRNNIFCFI